MARQAGRGGEPTESRFGDHDWRQLEPDLAPGAFAGRRRRYRCRYRCRCRCRLRSRCRSG